MYTACVFSGGGCEEEMQKWEEDCASAFYECVTEYVPEYISLYVFPSLGVCEKEGEERLNGELLFETLVYSASTVKKKIQYL